MKKSPHLAQQCRCQAIRNHGGNQMLDEQERSTFQSIQSRPQINQGHLSAGILLRLVDNATQSNSKASNFKRFP